MNREIIEESKHFFFRERKKITFECTNNANGDRIACGVKGSRERVSFAVWLMAF